MTNLQKYKTPKVFILDVDGVLTTGQFFYTSEGKTMKVFGPDDNDGLSLFLKPVFTTQRSNKRFSVTSMTMSHLLNN